MGGGSFVADWPELFTVGLGEDVGENSLGGRYTLLLIFFCWEISFLGLIYSNEMELNLI